MVKRMEMEWSIELGRQLLSDGKYDGYLKHAVGMLRAKLPNPVPEWEDLYQSFVIYALEAIDDFRTDRDCKFTTYLFAHLRMRSMQWFNTAWQRQNTPADRWIVNISALKDYSGGSDDDGEKDVDPTSVRDDQLILAELVEFREHLAPRSIQLLDYFLDYQEWDIKNKTTYLEDALRSNDREVKLHKLTGLDRAEIREWLWDLEICKTQCLHGFYNRRKQLQH